MHSASLLRVSEVDAAAQVESKLVDARDRANRLGPQLSVFEREVLAVGSPQP